MRKHFLFFFTLLLAAFTFIACTNSGSSNTSTPSSSLNGTWVLSFIAEPDAPFDSLFPDRKPTLVIHLPDTMLFGNGSCNNYRGAFRVDGNNIQVGALSATRMFCMGSLGEQPYFNALQSINQFEMGESIQQLTLSLAGTPKLRFTRADHGIISEVGDNSKTSLDWAGSYQGVLPCADCKGIETIIRLSSDLTYELARKYQGKSDEWTKTNGTFVWNASGSLITLQNEDPKAGPVMYTVGENQLIQLDLSGGRVSGELAEKYILRKQ